MAELVRQYAKHHIIVIGKGDKLVQQHDVVARQGKGIRADSRGAAEMQSGITEFGRRQRKQPFEFTADAVPVRLRQRAVLKDDQIKLCQHHCRSPLDKMRRHHPRHGIAKWRNGEPDADCKADKGKPERDDTTPAHILQTGQSGAHAAATGI